MAVTNVLKTTTSRESPLDASSSPGDGQQVSDFITIQSLTNFAAMTGAISAAWHALQNVIPTASSIYVPYVFAFAWAIVSVLISIDGLKKDKDGGGKLNWGAFFGATFVAVVNALVLAGAVIGTDMAVSPT